MKHNHKTAIVLSALLVLIAIAGSCTVFTYLPVSPERLTLTAACLIVGTLLSLGLYSVVTKLPNNRWLRISVVSIFLLFVSIPLSSAVVPRITYSRFGFTIYGATPIPVLDFTVNQHGMLWFRPKTHRITRAELDRLVAPGVEVVIVGVGWNSIAQLTKDAKQLGDSIDLRVHPTPDAFAVFNTLKAEGRCVVLLAHSTC